MKRNCQIITACIFTLLIFATSILTLIGSEKTMAGFLKDRPEGGYRSGIESMVQNNFARRTDWININGLFHRCMGTTIVRDKDYTVYKLSNGQIMYGLPERDMTKYAGYLQELNDELRKMDIDFMYVQIPFKIKDDSYMPAGTHANGNANADQLMKLLSGTDINTLDLRDLIEEQNRDWTEQFYNTDHHWRAETAFWAAGEIMKKIHDDYGFDYHEEYYDESNYDLVRYDNYMLGAVGRRTGIYYGGLDDFVLYRPKYDTQFSFKARAKGDTITREGDFWDSMYEWDNLAKRADFERNTYSTYTGKQYSRIDIKNARSDNGLTVLMIRESFTCALLPFIAVNADEVVTVDMRKYNKKSIPELCEEIRPDLVIVDYNPSAFSKDQFDFFNRGL